MFKIGDRVVCVEPVDDLVKGKTYTVGGHKSDDLITLEEYRLPRGGFFPSRFILATRFYIGAKVKCISGIHAEDISLQKGKIYTIKRILPNQRTVWVDGSEYPHDSYRFELYHDEIKGHNTFGKIDNQTSFMLPRDDSVGYVKIGHDTAVQLNKHAQSLIIVKLDESTEIVPASCKISFYKD